MNFYAMKNNGGTAWSPILGMGNFHRASRFGRVRWVARYLRGCAHAHRRARRAEARVYVERRVAFSIEIRVVLHLDAREVEARGEERHRDLAPMRVSAQHEVGAAFGQRRKEPRVVRQYDPAGRPRRSPSSVRAQTGAACPGVVDAADRHARAGALELGALVAEHGDARLSQLGDERFAVAEVVVVAHHGDDAVPLGAETAAEHCRR